MTRVEALTFLTKQPEWTVAGLASQTGYSQKHVTMALLTAWRKKDATRRRVRPALGQAPAWHYSLTPRGARALKLLILPPDPASRSQNFPSYPLEQICAVDPSPTAPHRLCCAQ